MCAVHSRYSFCRDTKKALRTSATFGRGIAAVGLYVPFSLQAIKCGIDGADGYPPASADFDLLPHGDSIGAIFQPHQCQQIDVLEFPEVIATRYYLYNID